MKHFSRELSEGLHSHNVRQQSIDFPAAASCHGIESVQPEQSRAAARRVSVFESRPAASVGTLAAGPAGSGSPTTTSTAATAATTPARAQLPLLQQKHLLIHSLGTEPSGARSAAGEGRSGLGGGVRSRHGAARRGAALAQARRYTAQRCRSAAVLDTARR